MSERVLEVPLADAAATETLGAALAEWLAARPGAVIYLIGHLGAGKTTLARGLLHALGVVGAVRSPTYTLLEPYEIGGRTVVHMDLYRLQDPEELLALGAHDYSPRTTLWLVEWPERGGGELPPANLQLELQTEGASRRAILRLPAAATTEVTPLVNAVQRQGLAVQTQAPP